MSAIINVQAIEILDSRGYPTVEVSIQLASGASSSASVPSGASTGRYECPEYRDSQNPRYSERGVRGALELIRTILFEAIVGCDPSQQMLIDSLIVQALGSEHAYSNVMLPVSMAVARAAAQEARLPLWQYLGGPLGVMPVPFMNIINGGNHANNNLDIQEFMIVPSGFSSFSESLQAGVEIYHRLKDIVKKRGLSVAVGDEGGFAPCFKGLTDVFDTLLEAIVQAGYEPYTQVSLALDCASSQFFDGTYYHLPHTTDKMDHNDMVSFWVELKERYPVIISLEDPMAEDDWSGWTKLTAALGDRVQLVGDDLFVTNKERLRIGIAQKAANSVLVKVNQIGTLTDTQKTVSIARQAGYSIQVSHRSGETEDPFIADLAVALSAGQIKTGAPCRSERTSKYNQLLRIEAALGKVAVFPQQKGHRIVL